MDAHASVRVGSAAMPAPFAFAHCNAPGRAVGRHFGRLAPILSTIHATPPALAGTGHTHFAAFLPRLKAQLQALVDDLRDGFAFQEPGYHGQPTMSAAFLTLPYLVRLARRAAVAAGAACLPLAGLSASAGADDSAAESFLPFTADPGFDSAAPSQKATRPIDGGTASYYASKFEGRPTASGERYRAGELTAAHRSLPFGSLVRVTNPANGKSVTVRVNDRGPFTAGRVIDVSRAAAEELGLIARGHAPVELEVIEG